MNEGMDSNRQRLEGGYDSPGRGGNSDKMCNKGDKKKKLDSVFTRGLLFNPHNKVVTKQSHPNMMTVQ